MTFIYHRKFYQKVKFQFISISIFDKERLFQRQSRDEIILKISSKIIMYNWRYFMYLFIFIK